jgi:hypothetical protein
MGCILSALCFPFGRPPSQAQLTAAAYVRPFLKAHCSVAPTCFAPAVPVTMAFLQYCMHHATPEDVHILFKRKCRGRITENCVARLIQDAINTDAGDAHLSQRHGRNGVACPSPGLPVPAATIYYSRGTAHLIAGVTLESWPTAVHHDLH